MDTAKVSRFKQAKSQLGTLVPSPGYQNTPAKTTPSYNEEESLSGTEEPAMAGYNFNTEISPFSTEEFDYTTMSPSGTEHTNNRARAKLMVPCSPN